MKSSLRRLNNVLPRLRGPLALLAVVVLGVALLAYLAGRPLSSHWASSDPNRAGQPGPHKTTPPPADRSGHALDGHRLVLASIDQLTQGASISARLHQRIKLSDGDVLGVGSYRQEAFRDGGRFNLQVRSKAGALLVVSDGNYVWHQTAIGTSRRITRVDLQYERLAGSYGYADGYAATAGDVAAGPLVSRSRSPLEFGGIGHLLTVLARQYRFHYVQRKILSDVPIYEVSGVLRPSGDASRKGSPLPPQVPSHVVVSLGQDDLFPYRIVFDARRADALDHERGAPRRVEIQFSEVTLGGAIDNRWFEYSPPRDVAWEDITAELVDKSGQPS